MVLLKTLAGVKGIGFVALMIAIIYVILEDDQSDKDGLKFNGDVSDGDIPEENDRNMSQKIREKYAPVTVVGLLTILEILVDGGFILLAK